MVLSIPLRLFVAMPGTSMGLSATWDNPDEIKKHFFEKIGAELGRKIKRPVNVIVEKDKLDLADAHLFSHDLQRAGELYKHATSCVPDAYKASTFSSVASPLQALLAAGVLDDQVAAMTAQIIAALESAAPAST